MPTATGRYVVRTSQNADRDLEAIADYMAMGSPVKAVRFIARVRATIARLDHLPFRGPVAPEGMIDGFIIHHICFEQYRILYAVDRRTVMIVGIRHERRLPLKSMA